MYSFKKSELRSGDIVKTKEGATYIVILNGNTACKKNHDILINLTNGFYIDLECYDENLFFRSDPSSKSSIVAISSEIYTGDNLRNHGLTKCTASYEWTMERGEYKKEMTISEIEKELGYSIKIVKED